MSYVYFARNESRIKIGFSDDPARRISGLKAQPIGCIAGNRETEASLHARFRHIRAYGWGKEWFLPTDELLGYIAGLDLITDLPSFPPKHVFVSVRMYADDHREMKIASAHRGEEIQSLISRAWTTFKTAEGKNLHKPQTGAA